MTGGLAACWAEEVLTVFREISRATPPKGRILPFAMQLTSRVCWASLRTGLITSSKRLTVTREVNLEFVRIHPQNRGCIDPPETLEIHL